MADLPTTVEELEQLAKAGGIVLVGAMATEAFDVARSGIARLFRRFRPDKQDAVAARLTEDMELVDEADEAERARVRDGLAPSWEQRLMRLLKENAQAEPELRELLSQVESAMPETQQQWVQTNVARDHGTVYAAQGGNVIHHEKMPPAPGEHR